MTRFDALPGYYKLLFLHLEPLSLLGPFIQSCLWGPAWFYNELVPPKGPPPIDLDPRAQIGIWQLLTCYVSIFLITAILFRVIRDDLSHDPVTQEKMIAAFLLPLAIADQTHIFLTFTHLPADIRYLPLQWNLTTHGNITIVSILNVSRLCWFLGVGRKRYYLGRSQEDINSSASKTQ